MAQTAGRESKNLGTTYQILLLIAAVLAIYYPVLQAGSNYIDDSHIVQAYGSNGSITLRDILLPGHRFYYRPVVELSYYLDGKLWGMDPSFMHLENVLLHALNTVLVYLLARKVVTRGAQTLPALPFLGALLFALHPVNSEAVSWIAGRTDPFATVFVLSSAILLAKALDEGRARYLYLSVFLLLLGALAKEITVFFLPAAIAMIFCWPGTSGESRACDRRLALRRSLPFLAASLAIFTLFLAHFFFNRGTNGLLRLWQGSGSGLYDASLAVLRIFGFYVKKLLVPAPLNFAIVTVNGYHAFFGLAAALGFLFWSRQRHFARFLVGTGLFLIAPALLVAVFKIAWTPVAERYLYLPSAFFCIGLVGLCDSAAGWLKRPRCIMAGLTAVMVLAAFVTVQRSFLWRDNLALYQNAVDQSPGFGTLRNELAAALSSRGSSAESARQFEIGQSLSADANVKALIAHNLLLERIRGKGPDEVWALVHQAVTDKGKADSRLLLLLRDVDSARLYATRDMRQRSSQARDLIDTNDHLYAKLNDPVSLYNNGQLSLMIGDTRTAVLYFRKAYDAAPEGAHYKEAARKLAQKLSQT